MNDQQIPNSVSTADLQQYLHNAPPEKEQTINGKTLGQLEEITERLLEQALEDSGGTPAIHKLMALKVIMNLGTWHQHLAEEAARRGDMETAANCMADYGQLRSSYQLLDNILVAEWDETTNTES